MSNDTEPDESWSHEQTVAWVADKLGITYDEAEEKLLNAVADGELSCLYTLDDGATIEVTGQTVFDLGILVDTPLETDKDVE